MVANFEQGWERGVRSPFEKIIGAQANTTFCPFAIQDLTALDLIKLK
jgi:hypothetical protein